MKQNVMFSDEREFGGQTAVTQANLDKIQQGLLIGLGSVLTYAVVAISSPEPFFTNSASIFLWLMLFLSPAIAGVVVYKFPSWQSIPLTLRRNMILQSFGLSVLALSTTIVFFLKWNPYEPGHWVFSFLITILYGIGIVFFAFRLQRRVENEKGDLFP
jgi:predicted membrane channel-forming protein YqfA (hemolysin III family)